MNLSEDPADQNSHPGYESQTTLSFPLPVIIPYYCCLFNCFSPFLNDKLPEAGDHVYLIH